jgi:uncharacterized protein with HEPN domain
VTKRSEREWLDDIIAWGDRLEGHLSGIVRGGFFASPLIQDATCKCIEAIGEAAGSSTISLRNWIRRFRVST